MSKASDIKAKILELKQQKNAVILTHYYQRLSLYSIADFVGDSLELSRQAAKTPADIIVFCGVSFMAETAKILSPDKKVLLPDLSAGCPMADMITITDLRKLKAQHPDAAVVCYVNSSAEIKAESDICCTSANAVKVVQSVKNKKIIFVPDKGLGSYVAQFVPEKEIILYEGYCPTHWRISAKDIDYVKTKYPNALVLSHPECDQPIRERSDYVGSTSGIKKFALNSQAKHFIIASEVGILLDMQQTMPDKKFILPTPAAVCENMKKISLEKVLSCLEKESNEIFVDKSIAQKAFQSIHNMLIL